MQKINLSQQLKNEIESKLEKDYSVKVISKFTAKYV